MSDFESVLQAEVDEREAQARAATAQEAEAREAERERFEEARHAALVLFEDVCRPLVEDFQRVMQARKILRDGRIRRDFPAANRPEAATLHLAFRALGAARTRRYYEIRLTADCARPDRINLSAQCEHYLPPDSRRVVPTEPPQSLVELPNELPCETVSAALADPAAAAAARAWCQEILKRSAAAVIDATLAFSQPAAPPAAPPLCAPLVADPIITVPVFGEAMSFER